MDHTMNIHLFHSRYSRVSGEIGTLPDIKGGILKTTIGNSVERLSDSSAIARVEIDVLAVPKDSKVLKDFAFRLGITVEGIFKWDASEETPDFSDDALSSTLSQSLYAMGVIELRDIAQKLGYSNINLPWDISVLSQKSKGKITRAPRKPVSTKRVTKAVTKKSPEKVKPARK